MVAVLRGAPLAAVLGAVAGLGVFVLLAGLLGRTVLRPGLLLGGLSGRVDRAALRLSLGLALGTPVLLLTRWPVAAAFAAGLGTWLPSRRGRSQRSTEEIARVEAIATWTEQLRDTLGASSGLQTALVATASLAPVALAPAVEHLAARLEYERTSDALRKFAADVAHPVADFVVAALLVAAEREARDLGGLLGQLASTAREEARLRSRIWVGRARTRTSVRVIALIVPIMVAAVMLLDRHYLDPYNTAAGQAVLLVVGSVFAASLVGMERMGRIRMPQRFVGRPITPERAR